MQQYLSRDGAGGGSCRGIPNPASPEGLKVRVISADDVDLNLTGLRTAIRRLFSHSVKEGMDVLDEVLSEGRIMPGGKTGRGGYDEVYLYNPADHPGHPDYSSSDTEGRPQLKPLIFVFNERIVDLRGVERQEYQGHMRKTIMFDWEVRVEEPVPFQTSRGRFLEFIVVRGDDLPEASKALLRHSLAETPLMPLGEWDRIKGRYEEFYRKTI